MQQGIQRGMRIKRCQEQGALGKDFDLERKDVEMVLFGIRPLYLFKPVQ